MQAYVLLVKSEKIMYLGETDQVKFRQLRFYSCVHSTYIPECLL